MLAKLLLLLIVGDLPLIVDRFRKVWECAEFLTWPTSVKFLSDLF